MTDGVMKEMPEVKKKLMETDIGDDKVCIISTNCILCRGFHGTYLPSDESQGLG